MTRYYIYLYRGTDSDNREFVEKHYYRKRFKEVPDHLDYIGYCSVDPIFFTATQTKYYDESIMYTRKDVIGEIRTAGVGNRLRGILEDYLRLKFSYIPQLLKHFTPDAGGYYTPHRVSLKEE